MTADDIAVVAWSALHRPAAARLEAGWVLCAEAADLCDSSNIAGEPGFDWASSCGILGDCRDEPLSAGDTATRGARAFFEDDRITVAFWRPPRPSDPWFALTGGALLVRTESLAKALIDVPELPRDPDLAVLALSRAGAMRGDRLAVRGALLAVEKAVPELRSLGASGVAGPALVRGVRASFPRHDRLVAARWARALTGLQR